MNLFEHLSVYPSHLTMPIPDRDIIFTTYRGGEQVCYILGRTCEGVQWSFREAPKIVNSDSQYHWTIILSVMKVLEVVYGEE